MLYSKADVQRVLQEALDRYVATQSKLTQLHLMKNETYAASLSAGRIDGAREALSGALGLFKEED